MHAERMNEVIDDDTNDLSLESFMKITEKLQKKTGGKYKFFLKAGNSYKMAIFNLLQTVWKLKRFQPAGIIQH